MIYEIGNLRHIFNGLCKDSNLTKNVFNWEKLVKESLLKFPQMLISDSLQVESIVKEIHETLSQNISTFLLDQGVISTLSNIRAAFLGGRGDLIVSFYQKFKLSIEEITGIF
jgi:hypothetical protein